MKAAAASRVDDDELLAEARRRFEVTAFRPGQREVIQAVLAGRDVIGIMPTGAGKSLCYQLPALLLDKATVVVSPLISLMQDQVEKLAQADIDAAKLNSTLTANEERETAREIRRGLHELVYVTPERLENPDAVADLARTGVALLVVDEAHCVSQWGHDFRPAYLSLRDAIRKVGRPPVLALTATATRDVIDDVTQQLELREPLVVNTGIDRPNLFLEVFRTVNEDMKRERLLAILGAARQGGPGAGIVYTATVKTADELWQWLSSQGLRVERYHAKRPLGEREETQRRFMASDLDLIVATKAFGMGIDKPDLRFVVHWQFPDSPESYYQEAGRAGRDGKPARVALLYRLEDRRIQSYFLGGKYPRAEDIRAAYQAMGRLLADGTGGQTGAVTARALAEASGLPERKVKVIVALLEGAGVLERGRGLRKRREFTSMDELAAHVETYQRRHRADLDRLRSMMRYAETTGCRSQFLRAYFGEADAPASCGHCDNCCRTEDSVAALASSTAAPSTGVASDLPRTG